MENKILINLDEAKILNESAALIRFGAKVKEMLYYMFAPSGTSFAKFYVKGSQGDVSAFIGALTAEKKYMDSYIKYGLTDPAVLKNKYLLDRAVQRFEMETGIKWVFK